ncbi:lysozyme inhibitor LprI family protein [Wohlfahrtiimonas populi]|uniref:lysozyme inhibitor LprI family protein n=1 Tax=Wohlfahrtiimonas populi TaxID=1940240 RepID=UPI001300F54F|nr:lysozyme inhibitor LprI family protein [Wohlfahrtiimonas populi]
MKNKILISVTLSLFFSFVSANELCTDAKSETIRNQCISQEYQKIDDSLNILYKKYRSLLDDEDKELLKAAQINWIKYKEIDCQLYGDRYKNGYLYHYVVTNCYIEKATTRVSEISLLINLKMEDQ